MTATTVRRATLTPDTILDCDRALRELCRTWRDWTDADRHRMSAGWWGRVDRLLERRMQLTHSARITTAGVLS